MYSTLHPSKLAYDETVLFQGTTNFILLLLNA